LAVKSALSALRISVALSPASSGVTALVGLMVGDRDRAQCSQPHGEVGRHQHPEHQSHLCRQREPPPPAARALDTRLTAHLHCVGYRPSSLNCPSGDQRS